MIVTAHHSHSEAALSLARQILARYGRHVDIAADIRFAAKVTPHEGSDRKGVTLIAYPAAGITCADDLLLAYYGDLPARTVPAGGANGR